MAYAIGVVLIRWHRIRNCTGSLGLYYFYSGISDLLYVILVAVLPS